MFPIDAKGIENTVDTTEYTAKVYANSGRS